MASTPLLAGDQGLQDGPPGDPEDVADDAGQLDVGGFQELDQAAPLRRLGFDQRAAIAQQIAQDAERLVRNKALAHQAMADESRQPLGIPDVGLAPRHRLDVQGVGNDQLEATAGFQGA
jgi:hypothetical protein